MKTAIHSLLALLAVGLSHVQADEASEFLQLDLWPDGIVFEIVESGEGDLLGLLPKVRGIIEKVRHMDPNIEFAVVSHGRE